MINKCLENGGFWEGWMVWNSCCWRACRLCNCKKLVKEWMVSEWEEECEKSKLELSCCIGSVSWRPADRWPTANQTSWVPIPVASFCNRGALVSCRLADPHHFGQPTANRTPVRFHFQNDDFPYLRPGGHPSVSWRLADSHYSASWQVTESWPSFMIDLFGEIFWGN